MTMTTANWITLIITLVGLAATWGGVIVRVKLVEVKADRTADSLEKSRDKQGERIGVVEERIATLEGAAGVVPQGRTRTRTRGVPTTGTDDEP